MTAAIWVLILLIVSKAIATDLDSVTCDLTTTCPTEYFCKDDFCASCINCKSQKRQSPSPINGISCAKSEAECGPCLPGYQKQGEECSQTSSTSNQWQWNVIFAVLILVIYIYTFREQLEKLICFCYKKILCKNSIGENIKPNLGNSSNGHSNSALNAIVTVSREVDLASNYQTMTKL